MVGEQCLQDVLSTDEQDFTDVCYASVRKGARSNIIFNHLRSLTTP